MVYRQLLAQLFLYIVLIYALGLGVLLQANNMDGNRDENRDGNKTGDRNGTRPYQQYRQKQVLRSLGGWTSKHLNGFFKVEGRVLAATDWYDDTGKVIPIPENFYLANSFYGEFGVLDRLDVIVNIPFLVTNAQSAQETTGNNTPLVQEDLVSGIGDIRVGVRYGILQNTPLVLSASLFFGLPTGSQAKENDFVATGDGEFNQLLKIEAGYSFYPAPFYLGAGVGFNNRTQNFSDEIHLYTEVGASFWKRFFVKVAINAVAPLGNGSLVNRRFVYTLFQNNVAYTAFGGEIGGFVLQNRLGLSIGADGALNGRNVLATPSLYLSVFYKLNYEEEANK